MILNWRLSNHFKSLAILNWTYPYTLLDVTIIHVLFFCYLLSGSATERLVLLLEREDIVVRQIHFFLVQRRLVGRVLHFEFHLVLELLMV
jgi:hypothetical protein